MTRHAIPFDAWSRAARRRAVPRPAVRHFAARLVLAVLPAFLVVPVAVADAPGGVAARESAGDPARRLWRFVASLDDKAIGEHRFEIESRPASTRRTLSSDARFDVRFLGITAYRYRHVARETWRGDCLESLDATTDDDGRRTAVAGQTIAGDFVVRATSAVTGDADPSVRTEGCLMSFAYWNPALVGQRRLLDPGSGRIETVTIEPIAAAESLPIPVRGQATAVRGLRILGLAQPIAVWYDGDEWVGLDTTVAGGRQLRYRLP